MQQDDTELIDLDVMDRVFNLFQGAYQIAPQTSHVHVHISSTDQYSVYAFLRDQPRVIHLFVSKQRKSYIYHEDGVDYAIDEDVTSENLARWLVWAMEAQL